MELQITKHSRFMKISIVSFFTLLVLYLSISIYFSNHFYFGSVINGINASGKTVEELDKEISSKVQIYTLELEERGGIKEQIKSADIGLKYDSKGKSQALKDSQNSFPWIYAFINPNASEIYDIVTYNEKLLKERFDKLSCFDSKNVIEPQNASLKYLDSGYVVVNEVDGNKINRDTLYAKVTNAILKGETTINLETTKCYINPKYTSKSKEITDTKNLLNKYTASKITYTFNGDAQVIDGSTIHNWLGVGENLTISFDEKKIKSYVDTLSLNYYTYGKERDFVTSTGRTVKVSGGNYGWLVDSKGEVKALIATIKEGQTITKEPKYSQTAQSHNANDIGNTYVEINLAKQHLWFYKNSSLIVEGDVVTGNVSLNHSTPTGVYKLQYKEKNATLKGQDYNVPVSYWMPFNGGIGIHDATWRTEFGGDIYLTNGSHGCVNAPSNLANVIFDNIDAGTPVICYVQ